MKNKKKTIKDKIIQISGDRVSLWVLTNKGDIYYKHLVSTSTSGEVWSEFYKEKIVL